LDVPAAPDAPAVPAGGVDAPLPKVLSSLVAPGRSPFLAVVESGIVVALGELRMVVSSLVTLGGFGFVADYPFSRRKLTSQ
jgi:hypothetical protein